ncbi:MAG: signal recognition particle-docking protein FtsY [Chloroflexota bacterium]
MVLDAFRNKLGTGLAKTKEAWFKPVRRLFAGRALNEDFWLNLEELLIGADVGVETTEKLLQRLRHRVREDALVGPEETMRAFAEELVKVLSVDGSGLNLRTDEPAVILVVGVNGSGKTTTIGKLAHLLKTQGRRVIVAAADTFRAAAIDQLRIWADRAGAEIIAHQPGADPAAVVYDALQAARARRAGAVIIDTAGRLQTKVPLMEELKKIRRVIEKADGRGPDETLLVLDATTGQNGLSQARHFAEAVGLTGIVLAKLDGTAKGGIVFAIADQLRIPIKFVGTGEKLDDLAPFDPRQFVAALLEE